MKYLLIPEEEFEFIKSCLVGDYDMGYQIKKEDYKRLQKLKNKKYPVMERPF